MSPHVIEAGPAMIRQFPCGETALVDPEVMTAALDSLDDPVALVDARPVAIDGLWRDALRSLGCEDAERVIVVHPSWWAPARIEVITAAAQDLADDVVTRPRTWLLATASQVGSSVIVEIAQRLVVVIGSTIVAEPRRGEPQCVADAVVRAVVDMAPAAVVIDVPGRVGGAGALAAMIAERLRYGSETVVTVDDARWRRPVAAASWGDDEDEPPYVETTRGGRRRHWALLLLTVLITAAIWTVALGRHKSPVAEPMPTAFLVEGRVAVQVPARWPTQRVIAGPGSARVLVTSPSDPQVALHVTQSATADQTLAGAAETLKHAIDAEPPGVFVDFNPSGSSAGRPAVTYREVRAGRDIRWVVVLDRAVRIAIGCQSRPDHADAVRDACELAVRSAHALR